MSSLLDPSCVIREQPRRGTVGDKNLKQLDKALAQGGVTKASGPIALDMFSTKGRAIAGKVPCLTRTRAGSGGYDITTTGGLLTTHEMLRLQGLPEHFVHTASQVGISQRQLRQMIGKAMSVNVLALVLSRLCLWPWAWQRKCLLLRRLCSSCRHQLPSQASPGWRQRADTESEQKSFFTIWSHVKSMTYLQWQTLWQTLRSEGQCPGPSEYLTPYSVRLRPTE